MVSGGFFQPCIPDDQRGGMDCSIKEGMHSSIAAEMASSFLAVFQPFHPW